MGGMVSRFWIIDDDLSFGRSLKRALDARGFAAEYFGSAQSFLDSVPAGEHGCAIVDIHMPVCNGLELMGRMRDLHYDIPVIIITGQPYGPSRELALESGAIGYFQKPFSTDSLLEAVRKLDQAEA